MLCFVGPEPEPGAIFSRHGAEKAGVCAWGGENRPDINCALDRLRVRFLLISRA